MGLDLGFTSKVLKLNGVETMTDTNGSEQDAVEAEKNEDYGYANWLRTEELYFKVPNMEHWVQYSAWEDKIAIRANKWGSTYTPVTEFLTKHNISWSEF